MKPTILILLILLVVVAATNRCTYKDPTYKLDIDKITMGSVTFNQRHTADINSHGFLRGIVFPKVLHDFVLGKINAEYHGGQWCVPCNKISSLPPIQLEINGNKVDITADQYIDSTPLKGNNCKVPIFNVWPDAKVISFPKKLLYKLCYN